MSLTPNSEHVPPLSESGDTISFSNATIGKIHQYFIELEGCFGDRDEYCAENLPVVYIDLSGIYAPFVTDAKDIARLSQEDLEGNPDLLEIATDAVLAGDVSEPNGILVEKSLRMFVGRMGSVFMQELAEEDIGIPVQNFDPDLLTRRQYLKLINAQFQTLNSVANLGDEIANNDRARIYLKVISANIAITAAASGSQELIERTKKKFQKTHDRIAPSKITLDPRWNEIDAILMAYRDKKITDEDLETYKSKIDPKFISRKASFFSLRVAYDWLDRNVPPDRLNQARKFLRIQRDVALLGLEQNSEAGLPDPDPSIESIDTYEPLDWTVLPEGDAQLEKSAREIVEQANQRRSSMQSAGSSYYVDLKRLAILKNIHDLYPQSDTYYARGYLNGRGIIRTPKGEPQPDEYIVLVVRQPDAAGNSVEHAVAESPIAGHNAIYVWRGDINREHTWEGVLSAPKQQARSMGARAVPHKVGRGVDLVEGMSTKVFDLLVCDPEDFYSSFQDGGIILTGRVAIRGSARVV